MSSYYTATRVVENFGFSATVFFNLSFAYITIYKVKKVDFGCKVLILTFSAMCLLLSTMELFLRPFYHSFNYGVINFNMAVWDGFGKPWTRWIMALVTGLYVSVLSFFSILFVFRFWSLTNYRGTLAYRFKGWKALRLTVYLAFVAFTISSVVFHFGRIDKLGQNFFRETLMVNYNIDVEDVVGFAVIAYEPNQNMSFWKSIRWESFALSYSVMFTMTLQYIIIGYCGLRIYSEMGSLVKSLSPSSRRLQYQFVKCLLLQITPPTLIFYIPTMLLLVTPYFNIHLDFPSGIIVGLFSFYPVFDNCIMVLTISEYRKILVSVFRWMMCNGRNDAPEATSVSRNMIELRNFNEIV